jgi:hypothetical protein
MQVTIELPERLAKEVERERDHVVEIFELGLRQRCARTSGLRREVLSFLARGPSADEIASFQPSQEAIAHVRELLYRSKEGPLSSAEQAVMDDVGEIDKMFSQLKAEALLNRRSAS